MSPPALFRAAVRDVRTGADVKIVEPANIYDCDLGDRVFVGPFVEIQKGVRIGARTRVQSHAFICELVTVGEDCFIGHGVMFVNDTFEKGGPARGDQSLWKSTVIGDRVSIGSNATLPSGESTQTNPSYAATSNARRTPSTSSTTRSGLLETSSTLPSTSNPSRVSR